MRRASREKDDGARRCLAVGGVADVMAMAMAVWLEGSRGDG